MTQISIEGKYLKADELIKNGIKEVTIVSEGNQVEKEFDGKTVTRVELDVETGKGIKTWSQNKTSTKQLVSLFGDDTKAWIGKKVKLQFVAVQGTDKKSIQVDEIDTQKAN